MASNSNQRRGSSGSTHRTPSGNSARSKQRRRSGTSAVSSRLNTGRIGASSGRGGSSRSRRGTDAALLGRAAGRMAASAASGKTGPLISRIPHRLKLIVVIVLIVLIGLFAAFEVLSHTDVFEIDSVEVQGSTRLGDSYLTSQVAIPKGTNLLNVDTSAITERLSANPWVASVGVHRSFPHTLVLQINENLPEAVVKIDPSSATGSATYWLIDSDGTWMAQVSADGVAKARQLVIDSTDDSASSDSSTSTSDTSATSGSSDSSTTTTDSTASGSSDSTTASSSNSTASSDSTKTTEASVCTDAQYTVTELSKIPIISGVDTSITPSIGKRETDAGLINALNLLKDCDEDFSSQIATLTIETDDTTSVTLTSGIEVAFGEATDMDTKIAEVKDLIAKYPNQIAYINVRVVSRPTWRGIE